MTNKDNGGPAFPEDWNGQQVSGMTLRDYFAAMAMQGMISNGELVPNMAYETGVPADACAASAAYEIADAMLKERSKP